MRMGYQVQQGLRVRIVLVIEIVVKNSGNCLFVERFSAPTGFVTNEWFKMLIFLSLTLLLFRPEAFQHTLHHGLNHLQLSSNMSSINLH